MIFFCHSYIPSNPIGCLYKSTIYALCIYLVYIDILSYIKVKVISFRYTHFIAVNTFPHSYCRDKSYRLILIKLIL